MGEGCYSKCCLNIVCEQLRLLLYHQKYITNNSVPYNFVGGPEAQVNVITAIPIIINLSKLSSISIHYQRTAHSVS
jgi:hypothetical protein